jgi:hypothetical protein
LAANKNAFTGILCLFSGMNRTKLVFLFCFLVLGACKGKPAKQNGEAAEAAPAREMPGDTVAGHVSATVVHNTPDTSISWLKTSNKISVEDLLSQVWQLDDADQPHWNEIFWDSASNKRQFPELALFRDFTVTENARCRVQMGKWHLNKSTRELVLRFTNGNSKTYIIRNIAMKQMELSWKRPGGEPAEIKLSAKAMAHKRPGEDPFYPANNQWRIKPLASESNEQIRQRVRQFVHFFALFYWDCYRKSETELSFSGLPCCFEWYNGGIGMQTQGELDQRWIHCFYSDDQAFKGYEMLGSLLDTHELKWPQNPTSWVQQTAQVLDQMEGKL